MSRFLTEISLSTDDASYGVGVSASEGSDVDVRVATRAKSTNAGATSDDDDDLPSPSDVGTGARRVTTTCLPLDADVEAVIGEPRKVAERKCEGSEIPYRPSPWWQEN